MSEPGAATGTRYPALERDIATAERVVARAFRNADERALRYQRRFRWAELAIIYGGVAAVGCGALGNLSGQAGHRAFSVIEVVLTAGLGALAFIAGGLKWHRQWLRQRLVSETLRGEEFLFVGRLGEYAEVADPVRRLEQRVVEIERLGREGGEESP